MDEKYGLGLVMAGLWGAMAAGAIQEQPVKPLAHLILGALGEAGCSLPTRTTRRPPAKRSSRHCWACSRAYAPSLPDAADHP